MEHVNDDSILGRAQQMLHGGDYKYARFLCYDLIEGDIGNIEARRCLNDIRQKTQGKYLVSKFVKFCQSIKAKYYEFIKKDISKLLITLEKYADMLLENSEVLRKIGSVAKDNNFLDLAIYSVEVIPDAIKTDDDYLFLAQIYMSLKKFKSVMSLAGVVLSRSPDNIEARDLSNQASAEKSISVGASTTSKGGVPVVDVSTLIPKTASDKPKEQPQQRGRNGVGRF